MTKSEKKEPIEGRVSGEVGEVVVNTHLVTQLPIKDNLITQDTQLTQYTKIPNLPTKDKIIIILYNYNLTKTEISEILSLPLNTISRDIRREDRDSGLSYDGLVEIKEIRKGVDVWGLTEQGRREAEVLISNFNKKEEELKLKEYKKNSSIEILSNVRDYIQEYHKEEVLTPGTTSIQIDFSKYVMEYPEDAETLLDSPEEIIESFKHATKELCENQKCIMPRFFNIKTQESKVLIGDIRSIHRNKFIIVEGIIKHVSPVTGKIKDTRFECPSCGNIIPIIQTDKKLKEPSGCGCGRKGKFRQIETNVRDFQLITLEETGEQLKGRNQPQIINIFLFDDLTNQNIQAGYNPGKSVRVIGILKETPIEHKSGKMTTDLIYFIEANNIIFDESIKEIFISDDNKKKILELSKDNKIFDKLSKSASPNIFGYELIKKACLLQLVRGSIIRRLNIHILLMGNPGLGKTILAKDYLKILPGSRFASGANSSKAGLGASVNKDSFTGSFILEAGCLTLANNTLAVLDEIDKLRPEDTTTLHEVMEYETTTINKAGVHTTLKASTSILATANPTDGIFDDNKPFNSQTSIISSLLDRFDLIFALREKEGDEEGYVSFVLNQKKQEETDIPFELVQKYIIYARTLNPQFDDESKKYLTKKYKELRKEGLSKKSNRLLDDIIRLSSAHSKIKLRSIIKSEDIDIAITLLKYSIETQAGLGNVSESKFEFKDEVV